MNATLLKSKTLSPHDLRAPGVAPWARALRRFAFRLGVEGAPFAVNGVLRRRFTVSRHKLWEYARSAAAVMPASGTEPGHGVQPGAEPEEAIAPPRILDFGGAATLPIFFIAARDCEVECLDLDMALVDWTNDLAAQRGWRLHASTHNLVESVAPAHWQQFDAVVSASVLEHIPKHSQSLVLRRLCALLRPGGVMAISFDYGDDAPQPGAIRDSAEVHRLVAASGLAYPPSDDSSDQNNQHFDDTGERFALDRRHPHNRYTFGSLFLQKM